MIDELMAEVRKKDFVVLPEPNATWYVVRMFGPGIKSETLCRIDSLDKAAKWAKKFLADHPEDKYEHKGDNWPLGTAWVCKRLGISIFLMEDVARNQGIPELSLHELLVLTREPSPAVFQYGMDHLFAGTATKIEKPVEAPASKEDYKKLVNLATNHVTRGA